MKRAMMQLYVYDELHNYNPLQFELVDKFGVSWYMFVEEEK